MRNSNKKRYWINIGLSSDAMKSSASNQARMWSGYVVNKFGKSCSGDAKWKTIINEKVKQFNTYLLDMCSIFVCGTACVPIYISAMWSGVCGVQYTLYSVHTIIAFISQIQISLPRCALASDFFLFIIVYTFFDRTLSPALIAATRVIILKWNKIKSK